MRTAILIITIGCCLWGIAAQSLLFREAGCESLGLFAIAAVPLLFHGIVAIAANRNMEASIAFLIGTLLSVLVGFGVYRYDLLPFIEARLQGQRLMHCGPPLVEVTVPIAQLMLLGVLYLCVVRLVADNTHQGQAR
ncbi:hypothetical protein NG895_27545 [Aeoliella sp. ICT_H6.2]|uniref:Uncharacterized protein n=1 Tax=Aeoliella straminimaris TaxID=2954799 RepID=A0A9X2FEM7_9BACT|nr:hypothetical protein [Aeoliella straminimaris]MCO6047675.1 hypothetical protein [Aeoliella straminimaris]